MTQDPIKTLDISHLDKPLVIISDVHLRSLDDGRGPLFLATLDAINPKTVSHLVLLGDIFDFCFGRGVFFQEKYEKIGSRLEALARSGVKILFFEGNHEFFIKELGWQGVEFVTTKSRTLTVEGRQLALSHGDRLTGELGYRIMRRVIRSQLAGLIAGAIPGFWLERFALFLASLSRKAQRTKGDLPRGIKEKLMRWFEGQDSELGVIGHFHTPFEVVGRREQASRRVWGLHGWEKPNILTFDPQSGLQRYYLEASSEGL